MRHLYHHNPLICAAASLGLVAAIAASVAAAISSGWEYTAQSTELLTFVFDTESACNTSRSAWLRENPGKTAGDCKPF